MSKSAIQEVISTDTLVKTGHSILKGLYVTDTGDIIYEVRDGTTVAGELILTIDSANLVSMPVINTPLRDGLWIEVVSGTTGRLTVLYE